MVCSYPGSGTESVDPRSRVWAGSILAFCEVGCLLFSTAAARKFFPPSCWGGSYLRPPPTTPGGVFIHPPARGGLPNTPPCGALETLWVSYTSNGNILGKAFFRGIMWYTRVPPSLFEEGNFPPNGGLSTPFKIGKWTSLPNANIMPITQSFP